MRLGKRKAHCLREQITKRQPMIDSTETCRVRNGVKSVREDGDLQEQHYGDAHDSANALPGGTFAANDQLVQSAQVSRAQAGIAVHATAGGDDALRDSTRCAFIPEELMYEDKGGDSLTPGVRYLACRKFKCNKKYNDDSNNSFGQWDHIGAPILDLKDGGFGRMPIKTPKHHMQPDEGSLCLPCGEELAEENTSTLGRRAD